MTTTFGEPVKFNSSVDMSAATVLGGVARSQLQTNSLQKHPIRMTDWRIHDAVHTNLPTVGAGDDLGIAGNTFGTDSMYLTTQDLKTAGATQEYARCMFQLPPNYVDAGTITVRLHAGMVTTVADVSAVADVEAWKSDRDTTIGGVDLYTGSTVSINSLTFANYDFSLTATTLLPGDEIDLRVSLTINDGASGTAVIGRIGAVEILMDVK